MSTPNSPTIITPKPDQHDSSLANFPIRFELHLGFLRLDDVSLHNGGVIAAKHSEMQVSSSQ